MKRRASFSPAYVKNHIFWVKFSLPFKVEFKKETFGDYYREKRQRKKTIYSIKEENENMDIPDSQYGVAMDYMFKVFPGESEGEDGAKVEVDDQKKERSSVRFLFHFTVKKYIMFLLFLTIMLFSWIAVLSNMVYNKFILEFPDRKYVELHNKIRNEIQTKYKVTNMLRLRTFTGFEKDLESSFDCSRYKDASTDDNLLISDKSLNWIDVIQKWADNYNTSSITYRRIIWYSAYDIGCWSHVCSENATMLHIYKCRYSFIPVNIADTSLMPYQTGLINDDCRNKFDYGTNLCINFCATADASELCEWAPQTYCTHFEAFSIACSARCQCPRGTIYYTPLHNMSTFCSKSPDRLTRPYQEPNIF